MQKIKANIICMGITLILSLSIFATDVIIDVYKGDYILTILRIILYACISYFIPDVFKYAKKKIDKSIAKKELNLLKKLFVISGSVKPVDFGKLMKTLIGRAKFFKQDLESIYEIHQKSNTDTEMFYTQLKADTKDIDIKLFYEKLDMAANFDFDLAVKTIQDDFVREKRENARRVKKKVELISIVGIAGLFIAIAILMIYLLSPWLSMLEISNLSR